MGDVLAAGAHRWVRGNRWDLVREDVAAAPLAPTAVIVPYFEQPASLARMYAALALADLPADRAQLVVVDDGSRQAPPPPPADFPLPWQILRQPDLGCRPGAARNAGVDACDADVLVFLDSDTIPAPSTVRRLAAWPTVLPDALVVGRRHHAELAAWSPARTQSWLAGRAPGPACGRDPAWLAAGYRDTADLLHIDRRSYRFVISAVMACHRALYDDIDGFDPTRVEYGGDDWELAARAFVNGAIFVHDPLGVAWHDELDWSERDGDVTSKNRQSLWLAATVAEPLARGRTIRHAAAETVVHVVLGPDATAGQVVATVESILDAAPDAQVTIGPDVNAQAGDHFAADARLSTTGPTDRDRQRCSAELAVHVPLVWERRALADVLDRARAVDGQSTTILGADGAVVAEVTSTRNAGRARRAARLGAPSAIVAALNPRSRLAAPAAGVEVLDHEIDIAAHFAGWRHA